MLTEIYYKIDLNVSIHLVVGIGLKVSQYFTRAVPVVASISIYLIAIHRYLFFSILLVCCGKSNTYLLD